MSNSGSDSENDVAGGDMFDPTAPDQPKREILCRDSIAWLNEMEEGFPPGYCGFTSLPDISELQQSMFSASQIEEYKAWFEEAVALFMSKLPERSFVIFLQSDVRVVVNNQVEQWVDKSHLCSSAADRSGFVMMWHKLVCLNDNLIKRSAARPTYSHLICYAKRPTAMSNSYISAMKEVHHTLEAPTTSTLSSSKSSPPRIKISTSPTASVKKGKPYRKSKKGVDDELKVTYRTGLFAVPDIFYRGEMVWSKGIGLDCCYVGVAFLKEVAKATCIVDPFAGQGTVLAMANALGVDALGVEISTKRCRKAKSLNLKDKLHLVSASLKNISLELIHEREKERVERSKIKLNNEKNDKIEETVGTTGVVTSVCEASRETTQKAEDSSVVVVDTTGSDEAVKVVDIGAEVSNSILSVS